jgi:kinesin family member C1
MPTLSPLSFSISFPLLLLPQGKESETRNVHAQYQEAMAALRTRIQELTEETETLRKEAAEARDSAAAGGAAAEAEARAAAAETEREALSEQLGQISEEWEKEVMQYQAKEAQALERYSRLKSDTAAARKRAATTVSRCVETHAVIKQTRAAMTSLSEEVRVSFNEARLDFARLGAQLVSAIRSIQKESKDSNARFLNESRERRRVFNLLQEVRGNIRVFCRVRPILPAEAAAGAGVACTRAAPGNDFGVEVESATGRGSPKVCQCRLDRRFLSIEEEVHAALLCC